MILNSSPRIWKELGVRLQAFKRGRDGDIDMRYAGTDDEEITVQCKHYVKSSYDKLCRHLRDTELQYSFP